jgi:hypothetical protein
MSRPILLFALVLAACGTPSAPATVPAVSAVAEDGSREVTMDVREQLI